MRIPAKVLDEFIKVYKDVFSEDLLRDEAHEMASDLIALYERLARTPPESSSPPHSASQ